MAGEPGTDGFNLQRFRPYLRLLALARLDPRLAAKLDASDVVQQTMLEAHRDRADFRGTTSGEWAAWLRRILARNLANALRDFRRDRRDIAREQALEALLVKSSLRVEAWLAAAESSPSARAEAAEEQARL